MTQEKLNQAVAEATGEDLRTIAKLGFGPLTTELADDGDRQPLTVDWDEVDLERYLAMCG